MSQHPADRLIRSLLNDRRAARTDEIRQILARLVGAPFNPWLVSVPPPLPNSIYGGRVIRDREPSLTVHLLQRVLIDQQWIIGTTVDDLLADIRSAIQHPRARLVIYERRGGAIAGTLTPTEQVTPATRRGPASLPWLYVAYAADRGILRTGYQASSLQALSVPASGQWLT